MTLSLGSCTSQYLVGHPKTGSRDAVVHSNFHSCLGPCNAVASLKTSSFKPSIIGQSKNYVAVITRVQVYNFVGGYCIILFDQLVQSNYVFHHCTLISVHAAVLISQQLTV